MAVQSHIESLKMRHQELETELSKINSISSADPDELKSIKRKKLQIKDRIEELQKKLALN